jgi:hypothetical protein
VVDKLERMGLTDLRKHVVFEHCWTPLDIREQYYSNKGSIYGVVSDRFKNLAFKAPKQSTKYPNLFFVGGSVNPGGGMPMVVLCGQNVAKKSVQRFYEDLSLFFNLCMTAGTVPAGLAGQFLLVRRDHYQLAGGHEAVHGRVLENFRLAEHLREAGVPLRCLPGKGILSFRMYPEGFRDLIHGWTKGFAAGAGGTRRGVLILVIAWMIGLMLAPLAGCLSGDWWTWGAACALCSLQVAWIGRKLGSFGWLAMLIYPLPLMFFFGLFGWSAIRSGRKVTWKGREIHAD